MSSGVDQRHLGTDFLPEGGIYIVSPACCQDWLIISPPSSLFITAFPLTSFYFLMFLYTIPFKAFH